MNPRTYHILLNRLDLAESVRPIHGIIQLSAGTWRRDKRWRGGCNGFSWVIVTERKFYGRRDRTASAETMQFSRRSRHRVQKKRGRVGWQDDSEY